MLPIPTSDPLMLVLQIGLAVSLAAACGLRAFLPVLCAALAYHAGLLELNEGFAWVASPATLVIFGLAVVLELAADKVPALDNALDAVGLVVKPLAGALVAAAAMGQLEPTLATVSGMILGGGAAGTVQLAKAKLRLVSTATTGGIVNPAISLAEDGLALGTVAVSILVPAATVLIVAAVALLAFAMARILARLFAPARVSSRGATA